MKKLIATILIWTCCITNASAYSLLVQKIDSKTLVPGIEHKRYSMLTAEGWITADVAVVDTTNDKYGFKVLSSDNGTQNLVTVRTLAQQNNAIVATNADFFNWGSGTAKGSPLGMVVQDEKLVSTPAKRSDLSTFYETISGEFKAGYTPFYITLTAPDGDTIEVGAMNKHSDLSTPCIYDRGFGNIYDGKNYNISKIVVVDNIVQEITHKPGAYTIPENGYILAYLPDRHNFANHLQVGDRIEYAVSFTPALDTIKEAVGAGTLLVNNGELSKITHGESGRHPRTAIGVDESGKWLYFVTVDGRQASSIGMTMTELQYFMLEIGCHTAVNFDGGGSTTLAYRDLGSSTVNNVNSISDSAPRPVTNAVSMMPKGKTDALGNLFPSAISDNVFLGTGIEIDVVATDEFYNPLWVDAGSVTFSSEQGTFEGNVFHPSVAGEAVITAERLGVTGTMTINVLTEPHALAISPGTIDLTSKEKVYVSVTGKDKDGYSAPIDLRYLSPHIENASANTQGNNVVKNGNKNGYIKISLGNTVAYAGIKTSSSAMPKIPDNNFLLDPQRQQGGEGYKFAVFGDLEAPKNLLQLIMITKAVKDLKEYDLVTFVGDVAPQLADEFGDKLFSANNYSIKTDQDNAFIVLNNRSGGMKAAVSSQWPWFVEKCDTLEQKNLFVMLPNEVYGGFSDQKELNAFFDVLEQQIRKGKNVYLLAHDSVTNTIRRNGIRYITINGVLQSLKLNGSPEQLHNPKYILFTINGNQVTYEYKQLY